VVPDEFGSRMTHSKNMANFIEDGRCGCRMLLFAEADIKVTRLCAEPKHCANDLGVFPDHFPDLSCHCIHDTGGF
jgi:hypothetical protein